MSLWLHLSGICAFLITVSVASALVPEDCHALRALYNATNGPSWTENRGWESGTDNCCTWARVTCDSSDTSVVQLWLGNNGITGELPMELGKMTNLINLTLSSNNLFGGVDALNNLTTMQRLDLSYNAFEGSLPPEWRTMTNLEYLILNSNNFSGELPTIWTTWGNIQSIELIDNNLHGSLPSEWANMKTLAYIYLSRNYLTGTIPTEWNGLKQLESLLVSTNQLSGVIDVSSPTLLVLEVYSNGFNDSQNGLINTSISSISFEGNPIKGLPTWLSEPKSIGVVSLRNTSLNCTLDQLPVGPHAPPVLNLGSNCNVRGNLNNLSSIAASSFTVPYTELDLSNTSINGTFDGLNKMAADHQPGSVFPWRNLNTLSIANCADVSGSLPWDWFKLVEALNQQLVLDVTNVHGLRHDYSRSPLPRVSTVRVPFGDISYECSPVKWPAGVQITGLNASYFNYTNCSCAHGWDGTAPHCTKTQSTLLATIFGSILGVIAMAFAVMFSIKGGRWLRNERKMIRTLRYFDHHKGELVGMLKESPWPVNISEIQMKKTGLGGSSADLWIGCWRGKIVAVKMYHKDCAEEMRERFTREVDLHIALNHDNIVQIFGYTEAPAFALIMAWMPRGSLNVELRRRTFSIRERHKAALDIARGMCHLHCHNICHRDLKSSNICIKDDGTCCLVDFGESQNIEVEKDDDEQMRSQIVGTLEWTAPELFIDGSDINRRQCDVYSYGIVLWELLNDTKTYPYASPGGRKTRTLSEEEVKAFGERVCQQGERPKEISTHDEDETWNGLVELMKDCWSADPMNRPPFEVIVRRLKGIEPPPEEDNEDDCTSDYNEQAHLLGGSGNQ